MSVQTITTPVGAEIVVDGRRLTNFGGSSYLGLSKRPELIEAGCAALLENGAGYQFPPNHGVATRAHQAVIAAAREVLGRPAGLYAGAGYHFGFIALHAFEAPGPVFLDEHAHFSLREATAASGRRTIVFRHRDADDLRRQLRQHVRAGEVPIVATDALFSTWGDVAPLGAYGACLEPFRGRLLVDESHAFGVLGATGQGGAEQAGLTPDQAIVGGSLGKAFAAAGGLVLGTPEAVERAGRSPCARGASNGLPAAAAMAAASLRYVEGHPELLTRLRANTRYLKTALRGLGLPIADTEIPIASFSLGPGERGLNLQAQLREAGMFVFHSTYIAAGAGGVIRIGIFADHTHDQFDRLIAALARHL